MQQSEQRTSSVSPREIAAIQVDANGSPEEVGGQIESGGVGPEQNRTDGGTKSEEAEAPERTSKLRAHPSREQTESR